MYNFVTSQFCLIYTCPWIEELLRINGTNFGENIAYSLSLYFFLSLSLFFKHTMYGWHSVLLSCFIVVQCMYHSHYSLTYFYLRNVQCGHISSTIISNAYTGIKNENHYPFKYVTTIFYLEVTLRHSFKKTFWWLLTSVCKCFGQYPHFMHVYLYDLSCFCAIFPSSTCTQQLQLDIQI